MPVTSQVPCTPTRVAQGLVHGKEPRVCRGGSRAARRRALPRPRRARACNYRQACAACSPHPPPTHPEPASGAAAGVTVDASNSATLFLRSANGDVTDLATTPGPAAPATNHAHSPHQGAATLHWLSWEAGPVGRDGGRLAYGRGTEASTSTASLSATLPPGTRPLARSPGTLPSLRVCAAGPCAVALGSAYVARQAGRAAAGAASQAVLSLSPHPLPAAPLSPLAAPPGWPTSLDTMAAPSSPVPVALLPNRTVRAVVEMLASPGVTLPPALAAAISHSLASPTGLLARTLAAKAARAGGLPYLRVGVAPRAGALAPGEPFVLEIWPSGSASPIHGHGGCCGGFVVLHGACVLRTFNSLDGAPPADPARPPLFEGLCGPGTVGWFDATHHQVHSITAAVPPGPGSFCATLQAFRYADCDEVRAPFMEIECVHGSGTVVDVDPESDFEFTAMAAAVLAEHAAAATVSAKGGGGSSVEVGASAVAAAKAEEEGEEEAGRFVWVI